MGGVVHPIQTVPERATQTDLRQVKCSVRDCHHVAASGSEVSVWTALIDC